MFKINQKKSLIANNKIIMNFFLHYPDLAYIRGNNAFQQDSIKTKSLFNLTKSKHFFGFTSFKYFLTTYLAFLFRFQFNLNKSFQTF